MDSKNLIPFVKSTKTLFETMFQLPISIGEPSVKAADATSFDVSGIIGFSGDLEGSLVLTFPEATAMRLGQLMTGQDLADSPDDLSDAIGELANMVAGGAKAQFENRQIGITCPNVVVGESHTVMSQRDIPYVCVPCESDCGEFMIEIGVRDAKSNAPSAAQSTAATA